MRRLVPDAIFIFVVAPSEQELERRQVERGSESDNELASRRQIAQREMTYAAEYDHVVTNDDIETAVEQILEIIGHARERQT